MVVDGGGGEFDEELADSVADEVEVTAAFIGGGAGGVGGGAEVV